MDKMIYEEIEQLVAGGESATLEFKRTTGELHKGMETACAFLNSDGGWLLFGVTPGSKIVGQEVTDKTQQEIANHLRKIDPAVEVEAEYIEVPGRSNHYVIALHFDVDQCRNSPYCYDGRSFYKVESTTALMPRVLYEEKLRKSNPQRFSWENTPDDQLGPDDLDMELVHQTLYDGIASHRIPALTMVLQEPMKILQKLGVAAGDGVLSNAALVLFGKEPAFKHLLVVQKGLICPVGGHQIPGNTLPSRLGIGNANIKLLQPILYFSFSAHELQRQAGRVPGAAQRRTVKLVHLPLRHPRGESLGLPPAALSQAVTLIIRIPVTNKYQPHTLSSRPQVSGH